MPKICSKTTRRRKTFGNPRIHDVCPQGQSQTQATDSGSLSALEQAMQDLDPVETQEWLDALESVLDKEGEDRAHYLMTRMGELRPAAVRSCPTPSPRHTATPSLLPTKHACLATCSWNAAFARWCVERHGHGNAHQPERLDLGGHISSFASSATLYDIGFNYFFQAPTDEHGGDLIYFQGHARQASTPVPSWKAASPKTR
jgi:pyruvate dehydrogenase E1 component